MKKIDTFQAFARGAKSLVAILLVMLMAVGSLFAQTTYSHEITAKVWSALGTQTLSNVNWTVDGVATDADDLYFGYDNTKGQQFGKGANPFTSLTITTDEIPGTITSITVNTSGAAQINATFKVKVGNTYLTSGGEETISLTSTATSYTFTGSAEGVISLEWAQTSSKAIYFKSIEVVYTTSTTPVAVETPTFTPAGGTYYAAQTVAIACATEGAAIYYTLDGTEPTAESVLYNEPIAVNATTTIKAIAVLGEDASAVATATYTLNLPVEVANIAAFKAGELNGLYKVTGDVVVLGQYNTTGTNNNTTYRLFVQDESGALYVYGNVGQTYNPGDVISGGIAGTLKDYNGQSELQANNNLPFTAGVAGTPVEPVVVTVADLIAGYDTYESKLVTIENVTVIADNIFTASGNGRSVKIAQGEDTIQIYNSWGSITDVEVNEGDQKTVTGYFVKYVNNSNVTTYEIIPRGEEDIIDYEEAEEPEEPEVPEVASSWVTCEQVGVFNTQVDGLVPTCEETEAGTTFHFAYTDAFNGFPEQHPSEEMGGNPYRIYVDVKVQRPDSAITGVKVSYGPGMDTIIAFTEVTDPYNGTLGDPYYAVLSYYPVASVDTNLVVTGNEIERSWTDTIEWYIGDSLVMYQYLTVVVDAAPIPATPASWVSCEQVDVFNTQVNGLVPTCTATEEETVFHFAYNNEFSGYPTQTPSEEMGGNPYRIYVDVMVKRPNADITGVKVSYGPGMDTIIAFTEVTDPFNGTLGDPYDAVLSYYPVASVDENGVVTGNATERSWTDTIEWYIGEELAMYQYLTVVVDAAPVAETSWVSCEQVDVFNTQVEGLTPSCSTNGEETVYHFVYDESFAGYPTQTPSEEMGGNPSRVYVDVMIKRPSEDITGVKVSYGEGHEEIIEFTDVTDPYNGTLGHPYDAILYYFPVATVDTNGNVEGNHTQRSWTVDVEWCRGTFVAQVQQLTVVVDPVPMAQGDVATLPYENNFDQGADFNFVIENGNNTNKWYVGQAQGFEDNKLYISSSNGLTNKYDIDKASEVKAYRDVMIPEAGAILSFDYRVNGEGTTTLWDYLKVDLIQFDTNNVANPTNIAQLNGQNEWTNFTYDISGDMAGMVRVQFTWINDNNTGNQFPAAIDNISIVETPCSMPTALNVTVDSTTATFTWTSLEGQNEWNLQYKIADYAEWYTVNTTEDSVVIGDLQGNTNYVARVQAVCGENTSAWTSVIPFAVACQDSVATIAPTDVEIGTGTSTNSYLPFYGYYGFTYSQQIYDAAEILATEGSNIYSVSFYCSSAPSAEKTGNIKIWMANTEKSEFTSNTDYVNLSDLTLVYEYPSNFTYRAGEWNTFTFDTPFEYTGGNLIIAYYEGMSGYSSSSFRAHSTTTHKSISHYSDTQGYVSYENPATASGTKYFNNYRSNLKLNVDLLTVVCLDEVACVAPTNLVVGDVTYNTAELTWTASDEEQTTFTVEYMAEGDADWTSVEVNETSYTLTGLEQQTNYSVRVKAICGENNWSDVITANFTTLAMCAPVTDITSYNTANSTTLTWTAGGTERNWLVQFKPYTASEDAWISIDASVMASTTFGGLAENTLYDVRVKALCDVEDEANQSPWTNYQFQSGCASKNLPYAETFGYSTPECWMSEGFNFSNYAYTSNEDAWMIAPSLNIPAENNTYLAFEVSGDSTSYVVMASYRGTREDRFENIYAGVAENNQRVILPISNLYKGRSVNFKFVSAADGYLKIDNVEVNQCPFTVTDLTVDSVAGTIAVLSWKTEELAEGFNVIYNNAEEEEVVVPVTDTTVTITGLDYSTTYNFTVMAACAGENEGGSASVEVTTAPACSTPGEVAFNENTYTLTWDNSSEWGTPTQYNIRYYVEGTEDYIDTVMAATDSAFVVNFSELLSFTHYVIEIQSVCSNGYESEWVAEDFTTPCLPLSLPYTQDFENSANTLPDCWTKYGTGTVQCENTNYVYEGSYSLKFSGSLNNIVAMPQFNADSALLSFYTRPEGTSSYSGNFDLGYYIAENDSFIVAETYNYNDFSGAYQKKEVVMHIPANATIAFRHRPTRTNWYWFVDNLNLMDVPTCGTPSITVNAAAIAQITPTVYGGNPLKYELQIGEMTQITPNDSVNLVTLFSLAAETDYEVSVRAICGVGDTSAWSELVSFTTPPTCSVPTVSVNGAIASVTAGTFGTMIAYELMLEEESHIDTMSNIDLTTIFSLGSSMPYELNVRAICGEGDTSDWTTITFTSPCLPEALPYTENFDSYQGSTSQSSMIMPVCWSRSYTGTSTSYGAGIYNGASYAVSGSKSLRMYNYVPAATNTATTYGDVYAVLPAIDAEINSLMISFDAKKYSASSMSFFEVGVVTDPEHPENTFTSIETIIVPTEGSHYDISMAGYTGANGYFAFRSTKVKPEGVTGTTGNNYAFIDNIVVDTIMTCLAPTNLAVTEYTANSATVAWTASNEESSWILRYRNVNDEEWSEETSDTLVHTVTGLTAGETYEIQVKADCGGGDMSKWTESVIFTLSYCSPAPTSVDNQGITNVTFGFGEYVVNNSQRPTSAPYYGDYSDQVGAVELGVETTVSITYATSYTYGTIIWIDTNNNLMFDGNEVVFVGTAPNTNPTVFNATFTLPVDLPIGSYRMRIAGADSYYDSYVTSIAAAANANPCPTSTYTIVHDYTIITVPAPTCIVPQVEVNGTVATIIHGAAGTPQAYELQLGEELVTITLPAGILDTIVDLNNVYDLELASSYELAVRAICGEEDASDWTNPIPFRTPVCLGGRTVEIGDEATSTSNQYIPTYSFYNYSLTQQIYLSSELQLVQGEKITSMSFNVVESPKNRNIDVYLAHTTANSFGSAAFMVFTEPQLVYSGITLNELGENILEFTQPFEYNGTDNIVVMVDDNTGSYSSGLKVASHSTDANMAIYKYNDPTNYSITTPPTDNPTLLYVRNNIKFNVCPLPSCETPTITINGTVATITPNEVGTPESYDLKINGVKVTVTDTLVDLAELFTLEADNTYEVIVRANCGEEDGVSMWSNPVSFFVAPSCYKPINLTVVENNDQTALLVWENENNTGDVVYVVEYMAEGDTAWTVINNVADTTYTLTNLTPSTDYSVRLKTDCGEEDGESNYTDAVSFTTWCMAGYLDESGTNVICPLASDFKITKIAPIADACFLGDPIIIEVSNMGYDEVINDFTAYYQLNDSIVVREYVQLTTPLNFRESMNYTFNTLPAYAENDNMINAWAIAGNDTTHSVIGAVDVIYTQDFEGETIEMGIYDADGDGINWGVYASTDYAHDGVGFAYSASWTSETGALTPNNWLFTSVISIPQAETQLKWWRASIDENYYAEHYSVVVLSEDLDVLGTLYNETLQSSEWQERSASLSSYAGQNVRIAFVHNYCEDMNMFLLDDISIESEAFRYETYGPVNTLDPITVPYVEDFSGEVAYRGWTPYDVNNDEVTMNLNNNINYKFSDELTADDWMISPCINLPAGDYTVSYEYRANSSLNESFEVYYGNGAHVEDMTIALASHSFSGTTTETATQIITITEDGTYNFGFHATSLAGNLGFSIDNFEIYPVVNVLVISDSNGTVTPDGNVAVHYGDDLTLSIVPDMYYHVAGVWVDDEQVVYEDASGANLMLFTLNNVTEPHTVYVSYKLEFHIIKTPVNYRQDLYADFGGHFIPAPTDTLIDPAPWTVTFTPDEHYFFVALEYGLGSEEPDDMVDVTADVVDNGDGTFSYTTDTLVVANNYLHAIFRRDTVPVIYTVLTGKGHANDSPLLNTGDNYITWLDYAVLDDVDTTVTFSADYPYHVVEVIVNGESQGRVLDYEFVNVKDTQLVDIKYGYRIDAFVSNYNNYLDFDTIMGTITPDTQYIAEYDPMSVSGTVAEHFHLYNLFVNGVDMIDSVVFDNDGHTYTFSMDSIATNYTIEAVVKLDTFAVTYHILEGQGYADASGLLTGDTTYATYYDYGSYPVINIVPGTGYSIGNVVLDGTMNLYTANNYQFNFIDTTHEFDVIFVPNTYTITTNAYGNGTVSDGITFTYDPENPVDYEFVATAAEGYYIAAVVINNVEQEITNVDTFTYVIENAADNYIINAHFSMYTYTMTAEATEGGTINPVGAQTVNYGTDVTYEITADEGWYIAQTVIDGETTDYTQADAMVTMEVPFTGIDADHTVSVTFAQFMYTITATAGANGTVNDADAISESVAYGSNYSLTITPAANYHVADVVVDGESVGAVEFYEFINIIEDHNVTVTFEATQYTLTATSNIAACSIAPANVTVNAGTDVDYTLTVADGYQLVNVIANGEEVVVTNNAFTIANVQSDYTIYANFASSNVTVTVVQPDHATITPGTQTFAYGATPSYMIVPEVGYEIDEVTAGNEVVAVTYNNGIGTFTLDPVVEDITLTATTNVLTYTIEVVQGEHGTISPATQEDVVYGSNVTFTITPDEFYTISDVIVDGSSRGALTTFTFNNVTSNHTITAVFAEDCAVPTNLTAMNITATSVDLSWVGTAPSYVVRYKTAAADYQTQTVTTNSLTLTGLTCNTLYAWGVKAVCGTLESDWAINGFTTANGIGIEGTEMANVKVYSYLNNVYIVNEDGIAISNVDIYDIYGKQIYTGKVLSSTEVISLNVANGNYVVRLATENGVGVYKVAIVR